MTGVTEKLLEDEITTSLIATGGYLAAKIGNSTEHKADFDPTVGLDTAELFAFIGSTQADGWAKLVKAHGGDLAVARQKFVKRLTSEIDDRGTVDVLRHGVVDHGVTVRLSYRRPAYGVAPSWSAHTTRTG